MERPPEGSLTSEPEGFYRVGAKRDLALFGPPGLPTAPQAGTCSPVAIFALVRGVCACVCLCSMFPLDRVEVVVGSAFVPAGCSFSTPTPLL